MNHKTTGGSHPWGPSHSHKFKLVGYDESNDKTYRVSCVYTLRVRLPLYIQQMYARRIIHPSILQAHMNQLTASLQKKPGYKVLSVVYQRLEELPELIVQLTIHEPYQKDQMKAFLQRCSDIIADTKDTLRGIFVEKAKTTLTINEITGIRFRWLAKYMRAETFLNAAHA